MTRTEIFDAAEKDATKNGNICNYIDMGVALANGLQDGDRIFLGQSGSAMLYATISGDRCVITCNDKISADQPLTSYTQDQLDKMLVRKIADAGKIAR